jgi:hypothetical protein
MDVPMYWDDSQFKKNFRMCRASFDKLVSLLSRFLTRDIRGRGCPLSCSEICGIALWRLATGNAYRVIDNLFGVGTTTCWDAENLFCSMVVKHLANKYIRWPKNDMEWKNVLSGFAMRKANFEGCVGAIDGFHVGIHRPRNDTKDVYRNRKGVHSLNNLIVCDSRKIITFMYVGWPGSVNDKRLVRNSSLGKSDGRCLPSGTYLPTVASPLKNGVWFHSGIVLI